MSDPADRSNAEHDYLHDSRITRIIEEALLEDLGVGDVTTDATVPAGLVGNAELVAKQPGVVAGLDIAAMVFYSLDIDLHVMRFVPDGFIIDSPPAAIARVGGPVAAILKAERTALNILQRMSGIATLTRKFVDAVAGTGAKITDTRKTAPGLRLLDKMAVRIGGGVNHRFGLDDMMLIKDNHIAASGGITGAATRCLAYAAGKNYRLGVEIETRTLEEVKEALSLRGIQRIMLDHFPVGKMREAVALINHAVEVEASGNVSLETVRAIAETGVDFISVGALTHSACALDISLDLAPFGSESARP